MTEEPQDEIEQLELLRRIRAQAQVDGSRITLARDVLADAAAHYTMAGIYEGRMPYRVPLDNAAYLENHQDVLSSIREGAFRSALDHFVRVGFAEGRTFWLASREAPDP